MIVQSGLRDALRGNVTTQPPCVNLRNAYRATIPEAITVPIAAPLVPNAGIGPAPRISTTLSPMFSNVIVMPRRIGVFASPAERSAPPSMKNTSMPQLNMNMMRRNGSASAFTAGAASTKSSSVGDSA